MPTVERAASRQDVSDCQIKAVQDNIRAQLSVFSTRRPSHTYILEAAMHLIKHRACDLRGRDEINAKWAIALLHFA
eukprot:8508968-Karenia_brevis.AAC.1